MKKTAILISLTLVASLLVSCISIQNTTFTDVDKNAGKEIEARATGTGYLHLTTPDIYSFEKYALENLKSQCKGKVINTTTRLETREFIIFQNYNLKLTGMCTE